MVARSGKGRCDYENHRNESDDEIQELRQQVELLTMQLDQQNVCNKLKPGYSNDKADFLSSSCGGYFGVSDSLIVNLPPIFDCCLEDDCELCSSKQTEQFGIDEFCKVEEKSSANVHVDAKKEFFELFDDVDEGFVNFVDMNGRVLELAIEYEKAISEFHTKVNCISEQVDFIGAYAFSVKVPEKLVDLVNEMKYGERNLWVAKPNKIRGFLQSNNKQIFLEDFCNPITSKYSKYIFYWSGQRQFQTKRVKKQIMHNQRLLGILFNPQLEFEDEFFPSTVRPKEHVDN